MNRYLEIDFARGIAVILMVIFHVFYTMKHMGIESYDPSGPVLKMTARLAHLTFIILSGINLYLSHKRHTIKDKFIKRHLYRAIKLITYGMIMTVLTYITFGEGKSVKFGILHFIGVAIILGLFIVDKPKFCIFIAIVFVFIEHYSQKNPSKFNSLCKNNPFFCFILGIYNTHNAHLGSLDHHSILSKFPFFAIGIALGSKLKKPKLKTENKFVKFISLIGQHSLKIYMLHWFILYIVIYGMGGRPIKW